MKAKQLFKFLGVNAMIGGYVLQAAALRQIYGEAWSTKKRTAALLKNYSGVGLKLLGFEVVSEGAEISQEDASLFVGNHLSYTDILVFSSFLPTCFVTSQEIRETPVLGYLCEVAGCLFVERRSRENLQAEVSQISEALENGCNVVVFPEATSTNGEEVLRFKRPLFAAATFAEKKVQPFTLNYESLNGQAVTANNRDLLFWYGDMSFVPHLWDLCGQDKIGVRITFHTPIEAKDFQDVSELASKSHQVVSSAYRALSAEYDPKETSRLKKLSPQAPASQPRPAQ